MTTFHSTTPLNRQINAAIKSTHRLWWHSSKTVYMTSRIRDLMKSDFQRADKSVTEVQSNTWQADTGGNRHRTNKTLQKMNTTAAGHKQTASVTVTLTAGCIWLGLPLRSKQTWLLSLQYVINMVILTCASPRWCSASSLGASWIFSVAYSERKRTTVSLSHRNRLDNETNHDLISWLCV